jgi:L-asparagine transporter-like permease
MKINNLIPVVVLVGVLVLLFFPNPESNFFAYIGTALFFIILISYLLVKSKKQK